MVNPTGDEPSISRREPREDCDDLGNRILTQEIGRFNSVDGMALGARGEILIADHKQVLFQQSKNSLHAVRPGALITFDTRDWTQATIKFVNGAGRLLVHGYKEAGESWSPEDIGLVRLYSVKDGQLHKEFQAGEEAGPDRAGKGFVPIGFRDPTSPTAGELYFLSTEPRSNLPQAFSLANDGNEDEVSVLVKAWKGNCETFRLPGILNNTEIVGSFVRRGVPRFLMTSVDAFKAGDGVSTEVNHYLLSLRKGGLVREGQFPYEGDLLFAHDPNGRTIAGVECDLVDGDRRIVVVDTSIMSRSFFDEALDEGYSPVAISLSPDASTLAVAAVDEAKEYTQLLVFDLDHTREKGDEIGFLMKYKIPGELAGPKALVLQDQHNLILAKGYRAGDRKRSKVMRISF